MRGNYARVAVMLALKLVINLKSTHNLKIVFSLPIPKFCNKPADNVLGSTTGAGEVDAPPTPLVLLASCDGREEVASAETLLARGNLSCSAVPPMPPIKADLKASLVFHPLLDYQVH